MWPIIGGLPPLPRLTASVQNLGRAGSCPQRLPGIFGFVSARRRRVVLSGRRDAVCGLFRFNPSPKSVRLCRQRFTIYARVQA